MPFLKGRLDTAGALVTSGHAKVVLVSGDGTGGSGNETAVMTAYLVNQARRRRIAVLCRTRTPGTTVRTAVPGPKRRSVRSSPPPPGRAGVTTPHWANTHPHQGGGGGEKKKKKQKI
jgi:hypothetical protein